MKRTVRWLWAVVLIASGAYTAAYLLESELHLGMISGQRIDHRLFGSASHLDLFRPLSVIEGHLRSIWGIEFYAAVKSEQNAWLPPPLEP
ncbi:hypothetical protein [Luteolibacter luteus]|uniref:Uncharacterized protein n=1 Tax=Luteolibacter luteus TaxID=2728835 RepID=A0A858RPJ6_9BACT|nr:hypothetical protein [Luteolibacter luteus]QJE98269.1 hypothetical protein HHL09_21620 [Luteolibacter luteus]